MPLLSMRQLLDEAAKGGYGVGAFNVNNMEQILSLIHILTFGIKFGPGAAVDIYGLQLEPQDSPSLYKVSTTGGCYENARLRDDALTFTSTDVNRHSATVNILYANNL